MQIADVGQAADDPLPFEGQDQPKHPVRGRMLRPHIDGHGIDACRLVQRHALIDVKRGRLLKLHDSTLPKRDVLALRLLRYA